jgi:membrane protease YdiL (CAAX protease family)
MRGVTTARARSRALWVSLAVISLFWAQSVFTHLVRPAGNAPPPGVRAIAAFVLVKAAVVLVVVFALLRADGETLPGLGFTRAAFRGSAWPGAAIALGAFVAVNAGVGGLLRALGLPGSEKRIGALFRDPREAVFWIFAAIVGGGFAEELVRAFVLTRFERAFGRPGLVFALVADTAVFTLGHLYQGITGAIQAGTAGVVFAFVFLWRRRVADAMAVHALFDLLGIAAAYALYAGRP